MANNRITTLGYFKKRLRDSGYSVIDVFERYSFADPREWTIMIDPGVSSVFCTLYKNANKDSLKESQIGDFYFEIYDGGQFLPPNIKFKTSSIEVLLTYLNDHNIINKNVKS